MPPNRTITGPLTAARIFVEAARPREAALVAFGLPTDFIHEFEGVLAHLDTAVAVRNNGRSWRRRAQTAIEAALADAMEAVRNLDAIVVNTLRGDAAGLGHWEGARRIEGMRSKRRRGASGTTGATGTTGERNLTPANSSQARRAATDAAGEGNQLLPASRPDPGSPLI